MDSFDDQMNRQDFLKTASAGVVVAGGLAAAAPAAAAKTRVAQRVGKSTKTLRWAMSGKTSSADVADPALNSSQHDGRLISAAYEQLTQYDESLRARPWLAESWEPNQKGDVWTFRLRRGVRFHDGDRLTAKDVVYSLRRVLNPATGSPGRGTLSFLDPDGITAVNDHTVRFRLPQPNAILPLSLITRQSYIVRAGSSASDLRARANGTGAFRVKQFTPGQDPTVFVKNTRYWQSRLPLVDAIQLVSISEPASRTAALKRGQVDVIEDPSATDLSGLRSSGAKIVVQRKGNMEVIAFQMDVPPFNDKRVRQALKYALDRKKMLQLVAQGRGIILNDIPIASFLEYGLKVRPRKHDVAKAKALLKQAGHDDGLDVKLAVSDVQARFIEYATAYKAMAADAGINVELDIRPADTYWDKVWLNVPMFLSAWIARPTDAMLALLFQSTAEWNETHWRSKQWDAVLAKARSTVDAKKRALLYQQLQRPIISQGGYLVAYMVNTIGATRRDVAGWKPSGTPFEHFATVHFAD
jgi:peptide/nickel transport system substrate-binding protein